MAQNLATQGARAFNKNLVKTFAACNPTIGTGIAEAIKTAWAATAALCVIRNVGPSLYVRPRYIRLINTVVPASGTSAQAAITVDTGATRYTSGGSALTAKNRDMSSSVAAKATVKFGALVTAAATASVRTMARFQLRAAIPVVLEEYVITFGDQLTGHSFNTLGGTAVQRQVVDVGPIILGPSQELLLHTWYPSNAATGASWECEVVWEEARK